ncbi:hypothetical protein E3N88_17439 [Mikania micrantha]|uniref:Uncharacterized protein n=1 Tax=Mikania micrantha TaxID=192012 RepID=A0A5N6NTQ0_9ASTR|nr:hypothetical protein E3N88_17439 [Mikania micrantha]
MTQWSNGQQATRVKHRVLVRWMDASDAMVHGVVDHFLDTIKDHHHPSVPLDAKEDEAHSPKTISMLPVSVEQLNDKYKKMKISSDLLPRNVVHLKKSNKKIGS